ncbi:uncharacterized protein TNCV_742291 [Trichonephila clavipes]|nr:uncharacterized protein TNCV_742291 [Trichonephila clavipes]
MVMRGCQTARCLLLVSPLVIHFPLILKTAEHEQPTSHAVSEVFDKIPNSLISSCIRLAPTLVWLITMPTATIIMIFTHKTQLAPPYSMLICPPHATYYHLPEFVDRAQQNPRRVLRTAFTLSANKIESELKNEVVDLQKISLLQVQLKDKYLRLKAAQEAVSGTLLQLEDNGEEFETDFTDAESYREKYLEYYTRIDKKLGETVISEVPDTPRKFKLPKLELRKIGGDPKEFLSFWSQFQKIHDNGSIPDEDKMQYLVTSVEPKSKAERLILSFPATAANYPKTVDQLKERFEREDLLVQIYVRDILTMVMKNAVSGRAKTDLSRLYDELEGKLRALESLGRTQEKFRDFLAPLVESCLPEEVLMSWERNRNHHELSDYTAGKNIRSLENLMTFLRQEVQGEEMVVLSRTGFASNKVTRKKEYVCTPLNEISGDPATCRDRTVYLQTLCVIARDRGRERRIRILLDSASQYSHVSERLIAHLGLIPHRYENIIHSLFGGTQTKPKKHGVYSIELTALNGDYSCLEVLSEEKICNSVPKINEKILNNLRELNIELSDSFSEDLEIDLLVGSNVLGRILMKKCCELDSGLSVVETKLGNTVIGMQEDVCHIDKNVMTLSMYARNIKLTDLWSLENLGISNPTLEESKQNSYEDALDDFQQKLTILPNGRYELQLPWKHDPVNLPDNKGLTWARHEKVIKRAESNGFLREYQNVFEDWENLGIIEIVPEKEVKAVKCHYLAHRPVIKLQSETTKYRPCFDGSACENVQKVFDANGLSPATLPPKLILQETWKLELPWDSELPKSIVNKFMKWANEMYLLKVTVPRYIVINETSELHIFVDASKSSYGACVFVRTVVENDVKVTLLRSKARVAPLKSLAIPRLELMSCCIGARLANSIIRALNLPGIKVIYWSDSEVALWWIREQGNWSVSVANRVKVIRELTQFQSWRNVPSNMNIADLLSQECIPQKMLDSKWWEGPRWLKNNREQWPANEINCEPKDGILEKRKSELVNVNISEELVPWYAVRFSKYNSIVRLMGWILRLINNSRVHVEERKLSELSSDDIENAKMVLIRLVQDKMFPNLKSIPIVNTLKIMRESFELKLK